LSVINLKIGEKEHYTERIIIKTVFIVYLVTFFIRKRMLSHEI